MKRKIRQIIPSFLVYFGAIIIMFVLSCKDEPIGKIYKIIDLETEEVTYRLIGEAAEWKADTNQHGGIRQWYGGKPEPSECHIVLYTPGQGEGGGPQEVFCAGSCDDGETCTLIEAISGEENGIRTIQLQCECR